jgi:tripartite-type tricarboxylate transporter receptor subunit TctC
MPDFDTSLWFGLLAPAGTPRDVVAALAAGVARAAKDPDMKRRLEEQGGEPVGSTPEEFAALLREEVAKWAEVVKVSGAKPN